MLSTSSNSNAECVGFHSFLRGAAQLITHRSNYGIRVLTMWSLHIYLRHCNLSDASFRTRSRMGQVLAQTALLPCSIPLLFSSPVLDKFYLQ